jgi:hypothetical protein
MFQKRNKIFKTLVYESKNFRYAFSALAVIYVAGAQRIHTVSSLIGRTYLQYAALYDSKGPAM